MRRSVCWIALALLTGCADSGAVAPVASAEPSPRVTPAPQDTGWQTVSAGIEIRELDVTHQAGRDRLHIARVDPSLAAFEVRYTPGDARRLDEWLNAEQARLVINGGFFDPNAHALGLLISDGRSFGETYVGLGGLFGVSGGRVQVRSLVFMPYSSGESFDQLVQCFPMLVNGGAPNVHIRDDGDRAPRSVVGLDRQGRVVFLLSLRPIFRLTDLGAWLARSDLDLDSALNLDGGTSSGLVVRTADGVWGLNSWGGVPAVIVVR